MSWKLLLVFNIWSWDVISVITCTFVFPVFFLLRTEESLDLQCRLGARWQYDSITLRMSCSHGTISRQNQPRRCSRGVRRRTKRQREITNSRPLSVPSIWQIEIWWKDGARVNRGLRLLLVVPCWCPSVSGWEPWKRRYLNVMSSALHSPFPHTTRYMSWYLDLVYGLVHTRKSFELLMGWLTWFSRQRLLCYVMLKSCSQPTANLLSPISPSNRFTVVASLEAYCDGFTLWCIAHINRSGICQDAITPPDYKTWPSDGQSLRCSIQIYTGKSGHDKLPVNYGFGPFLWITRSLAPICRLLPVWSCWTCAGRRK